MFVPVSRPFIDETDVQAVAAAVRRTDISGAGGSELKEFEKQFAEYCSVKHAITCSSGTTALHLCVRALGIGAGDEVLVQAFTNMATHFAVVYEGAKPVPIDSEARTLNIDVNKLEEKITPRTKAIVVHIYGHPVDMDPVMAIAEKHGLYVIEDCAEAHGALYKGKKVGSIGHISAFSFYVNKLLATGEGGAVTTHDDELAAKVRSLKALAFGKDNKFMHQDVGFNYRMTNMQCALGLSQLKKLDSIIEQRRALAQQYNDAFADLPELCLPIEESWAKNVYWMYNIVLRGSLVGKRTAFLAALKECGVEAREDFVPASDQQIFIQRGIVQGGECPIATGLGENGFYIPSGPDITPEEVAYVITIVRDTVATLRV
jgi:perosamine synthetase